MAIWGPLFSQLQREDFPDLVPGGEPSKEQPGKQERASECSGTGKSLDWPKHRPPGELGQRSEGDCFHYLGHTQARGATEQRRDSIRVVCYKDPVTTAWRTGCRGDFWMGHRERQQRERGHACLERVALKMEERAGWKTTEEVECDEARRWMAGRKCGILKISSGIFPPGLCK